jgi:hypothetical protein
MRNLMKLIAITAMTVLLLCALITCASADEKIYTSPVFKLPRERLEQAEEILDSQEQDGEPEESEEPAEGTDEEGDIPEDEEGDVPEEDEDEDFEELGDDAGEMNEEPGTQKREVIIRSSQGAVVTEGDQITMTSELRGFGDDEQVEYQWQVDRGDGAGWVDISGATKFKYTFIANEETIKYSWRLIVNVVDQ